MRRRPTTALTALLLAATAAGGVGVANTLATAPAAQAAAPLTTRNGLSSDQAAPSCFAIKQSFPSSKDGRYWLLTPTLVRPQVFYCDMTTSGGGWELIGRGRDGWSYSYFGQGTAAQVALSPSGTGAFTPATLPSWTVDGLLDGHTPASAYDGVRIRRAMNSSGTVWQDARIHFAFLDHFTWEWALGQPLTTVSFGSVSATVGPQTSHFTGSTYDARIPSPQGDNTWQLLHTGLLSGHNQRKGFAYGSGVKGSTSSASYLWTATPGGSYALPFTQVYIRPHFGDADVHFTAPPVGGSPAPAPSTLPNSFPQKSDWGVAVLPPNTYVDPDPQGKAFVYALAQVGNTMYVGGKFQQVVHHSTHTAAQLPWLAAFDVNTGVWIRTFTPTLDGAVYALAATPDNKLLVAGNFTNIDGVPNTAGLAEIDPTSPVGQPVAGWQASLSGAKFNSVNAAYARTIAIGSDNNVYVAGDFRQVVGSSQTVTTGGIARVALADGTPDLTWHPFANGTVMDIHPNADVSRIDVAGNFSKIGTNNTNGVADTYDDGVALLDPTTGLPNTSFVSNHDNYSIHWQDSVTETPSLLVHGGQQWWLAGYDVSSLTAEHTAIEQPHGDIQTLRYTNGYLFGGCHCSAGETYTYGPTPTQYSRVDSIDWLGAWDPTTLGRVPSFAPQWGAVAEGVWTLTTDSSQCLWAGGDIDRGATTSDWLSGFARFCPLDLAVPSTPGTPFLSQGLLWWNGSYDGGDPVSYEVIRNDRVIITTSSNRIKPPGRGLYYIRAIDSHGNRSATTHAVWV